MKSVSFVLPFFAHRELWIVLRERREAPKPVVPEPPKHHDETAGPMREFPSWTWFIHNPRPQS